MRSGGITAEQWATVSRHLGGLSKAIYAIRRDHGRTMGLTSIYLGGLSGRRGIDPEDHGRTTGQQQGYLGGLNGAD